MDKYLYGFTKDATPKITPQKKIINFITYLVYFSFFAGVIITCCLGAILQNFYRYANLPDWIKDLAHTFWFEPRWQVWLIPIPIILLILYFFEKFMNKKINKSLEKENDSGSDGS